LAVDAGHQRRCAGEGPERNEEETGCGNHFDK
jgi:hypothetical protein